MVWSYMIVSELKEKLALAPEDGEVVFDDLQGGRIPVTDLRIEQRVKFEKPGAHSETALVVIIPKTGLRNK